MPRTRKPFVAYLALWGCVSTGAVYVLIGVIALLSFFRLKDGGADEGSLMAFLQHYAAGRVLIGFLLLGMCSFIFWRFRDAFLDPQGYGRSARGIARRAILALSSLADILIAWYALQALRGHSIAAANGQPRPQRAAAGALLKATWGDRLLMTLGIITLLVAAGQVVYAFSKGYRARMRFNDLPRWKQRSIDWLAWTGHAARGVIVGIMGWFFFKAGHSRDVRHVVNTDKAFDFIGDHLGGALFIAVALGTVCFGIFFAAFGRYYDTGKRQASIVNRPA
ncbi:MAG: DUF1206 domain-containing protein [Chitinophagaceae bacterium]|nr:MAG: DUF1206 domain-containing protein [Chitinophagaceae bacterium]